MKFHFKCKIGPWDFWFLSMKKTYSSPVGLVNIIFTLAMMGLSVKFISNVNDFMQVLLVLLCLIFPVIQPIFVYFKAKSQTMLIPANLEFDIDDAGIEVSVGNQKELIKWKRVKGIIKESNMVIIRVDDRNGYFLTNRALGKDKEEFIQFIEGKI